MIARSELAAVRGVRLLFGHQSVGDNILHGVRLTYEAALEPVPIIIETRENVPTGPFLGHAYVGVNAEPQRKLADFVAIIDGRLGQRVDMAVLKFCYVDITSATNVDSLFEAYVSEIEELEERHPSVRFLHATAPLTTDRSWRAGLRAMLGQGDRHGPDDNLARHRYNTLMRARYGSTGRLFDIAAVEATMEQSPMLRERGGNQYYVLNRRFSTDAGHLSIAGSRAAAVQFLRVVAANSDS